MLTRTFAFLCRFAPLKRTLWRSWYGFLARHYDGSDWTFMNYGYAGDPIPLDVADERNRNCIQLYHHVAGACDLRGKTLLEVGSGRGGGASYAMRYLGPSAVTGLDFSANAVEFCRRTHRVTGLSFETGNAEAMPFNDASFDAVINVESSHCYGSMDAFLSEVRRVLRPGGHFLYADLRDRAGLSEWRAQLGRSGLTVLHSMDITPKVLRALDADNEQKAALIRRLIPKPLLRSFQDFAGMRGSLIYEGFRTGGFLYYAYKLEKR